MIMGKKRNLNTHDLWKLVIAVASRKETKGFEARGGRKQATFNTSTFLFAFILCAKDLKKKAICCQDVKGSTDY